MNSGVAGGDVLCRLGTRLEAAKLAPVAIALAAHGTPVTICCTGQQRALTRVTLTDFGLVADLDLDSMRPAPAPGGCIVSRHPQPAADGVLRALLADFPRVTLVAPIPYLPFIMLLRRADHVLTDSGGIEEEAPALECPVLVLRDSTERPEGVAAGVARRVGTDPALSVATASTLRDDSAAQAAMTTSGQPYDHPGDRSATAVLPAVQPRAAA